MKHLKSDDVSKAMRTLVEKIILKSHFNPKHKLDDIVQLIKQIEFVRYPDDKQIRFK